jgi:hypothetical protein
MQKMMLTVFGVLLTLGAVTTFTDEGWLRRISVQLSGYEETPLALSTPGGGRFVARISKDQSQIEWQLTYGDLSGAITQAHIHFGAPAQTGGISLFLCTNLGNGPAGTQACPPSASSDAPLTGTATAADILGPAGQGIAAGELAELIAAIRAGAAYVNVHSNLYPAGEIRAQLPGHKHDGQ